MVRPSNFTYKIVCAHSTANRPMRHDYSIELLTPFSTVVHTMSELHFPGNCLKGSRPILSFDKTFDSQPHFLVIKELLTHIFGVPKHSRKTKPFIDHVMGFSIIDGKIWVRCFEISETELSKGEAATSNPDAVEVLTNGDTEKENAIGTVTKVPKARRGDSKVSLVEIGPRFVMTPIVILESSFGGPVIYENRQFVSPNQIRSEQRREKAGKYVRRAEQGTDVKEKKGDLGLGSEENFRKRKREGDELDERVLFA